MIFSYSDYCTAFYVPEASAVLVYDEIEENVIQTIPAATESEADRILFSWRMRSPCNCISEVL
jgi:hypothetical protein